MYQPSRHLSTFFIAGFQHYDGALVINQMSIGDSIELCPEPGNPYDPESIALYFNGVMIGYAPADQNSLASTLFHFATGTSSSAAFFKSIKKLLLGNRFVLACT